MATSLIHAEVPNVIRSPPLLLYNPSHKFTPASGMAHHGGRDVVMTSHLSVMGTRAEYKVLISAVG